MFKSYKYIILIVAFMCVNAKAAKLLNSINFPVSQETVNIVDPILKDCDLGDNLNIILMRYEDPSNFAFTFKFGTIEGRVLTAKKSNSGIASAIYGDKTGCFLVIEEEKFQKLNLEEQKYWLYNCFYFLKNSNKIEANKFKIESLGLVAELAFIYKIYKAKPISTNRYINFLCKYGYFLVLQVPVSLVKNAAVDLYIRNQEYKADQYAYSKINNLDVIKAALEKSEDKPKSKFDRIKNLLSFSSPAISKRINNLKKKLSINN